MKYIISFCLIFSVYNHSIGQIKNGFVEYKIKEKMSFNDSKSEKKIEKKSNSLIKNALKKLFEGSQSTSDIEFELIFNSNFSYFSKKEKLKRENDSHNVFKLILQTRDKIITDFKNKVTLSRKDKYNLVVSDSLSKFNWKLINETKKIGNFLCYKAIGSVKLLMSSSKLKFKNQKIVAWYCPKININSGPSGYGGLPGLILELKEEGRIVFYASKLNFNLKKKLNVKKEFKGKIVTRKQYNNILKDKNN